MDRSCRHRRASSTLEVKMLSISEVAERTGLRPSALRYYEEVGLISSPTRRAGRRHYPDSVLERLRLIACVQACGFTIAEIRALLVEDGCGAERWRPLAEQKLLEIRALMEKAELTRRLLEESLRCECRALEECSLIAAPAAEAAISGDRRQKRPPVAWAPSAARTPPIARPPARGRQRAG